jgi:3-deoxy-7-phosphoheptulonate synthase
MVSPTVYWRLTEVVNPDRIPGKVIIIGRYGADKVDKHLPGHIEAVKGTDHVVVWQCDAMVSLSQDISRSRLIT